MKKLALFVFVLVLGLPTIAQMKYQPKTIVVFRGEKNSTFDESKYPNMEFYYTPDIKLEELIESTKEKESLKATLSVTGLSLSEGSSASFTGTPELVANILGLNTMFFFDKNAVVSGWKNDHMSDVIISAKKNLQGSFDVISFDKLCKNYIKKGAETKVSKKEVKEKNKGNLKASVGHYLPEDFEVEKANGEKISFTSLVTGHALTMVVFAYLNPIFDLKQGMESGADKSGKEYAGDVVSTIAAKKQIDLLNDIENQIYGYKVEE